MAPDTQKIQEYFASMNSLSARICSDIRAIEDNMVKGADEECLVKLTYNDKCAAIDKHLIEDVLEKNAKNKSISAKINRAKSDPSTGNHLQALIQSVIPPKPEKYVFEEAGGVWLDEHSAPFSFCKQSQVKCCALGKGVLQNLAETEPADVVRRHASKNVEKRRRKPDMKNKAPAPIPNEKRNSMDATPTEIQPRRSGVGKGIFGVNVMDFMGSGSNSQIQSTKITPLKSQEKRDEHDEELEAEMEDKLPQQKQNLQLIAELQAKLKRTNPSEAEETKVDSGIEQKPKESCEAHPLQVVETKAEAKQAKKKNKLKKPKAPPPPPPRGVPKQEPSGTAVQGAADSKSSSSGLGLSLGKHQKAMADQFRNVIAGVKLMTHSRKHSSPSEPVRAVPVKEEIPGPSKPQPPLQRQTSKSGISRSRSKGDNREEATGSSSKKTDGGQGQEFCVDVSSPCKIATPKTGLDFLDNW